MVVDVQIEPLEEEEEQEQEESTQKESGSLC